MSELKLSDNQLQEVVEIQSKIGSYTPVTSSNGKPMGTVVPTVWLATELLALRQRIAELEANRWIPVGERLPEEYGYDGTVDVLVFIGKQSIVANYWRGGYWNMPSDYQDDTPTHWRPLPTPPEAI